ncbi:MAG TPA: hypothetical protein VMM77_02035, partial [Gemmatimonadaceae bacterium]|nr:hypothetical protein [Gemmatimonadaceae bacterium]
RRFAWRDRVPCTRSPTLALTSLYSRFSNPPRSPMTRRRRVFELPILLAVCAAAFTITIILYVFAYGQPAGTGAGGEVTLGDAAAHMLDRWKFIS